MPFIFIIFHCIQYMLYGSTRMDDHAIRDMQLEGLGNGKEQGIYNFSKKTT